jgi:glycosyltransferase involved in cell wall biosynthesis
MPASKINSVSIVIPVYNEEKTIYQALERIKKSNTLGLQKQFILINDGSTDKTKSEILKFVKKNLKLNIKLIEHQKNLGKGAALQNGFRSANGGVLIVQDADLEYHPRYYPQLLRPIVNHKTKVVYGSRFLKSHLVLFGKNKTLLPLHYISNKLLSKLASLILRTETTDMETGYKAMAKSVYQRLEIASDGFEVEPEITTKIVRAGYKITEIPIETKPRGYSKGKKITWKDGVKTLFFILKQRLILS